MANYRVVSAVRADVGGEYDVQLRAGEALTWLGSESGGALFKRGNGEEVFIERGDMDRGAVAKAKDLKPVADYAGQQADGALAVLKRTIEGNPHDLSKEHLDVLKARAAKLEAKVAKAKAKAKQGKAQDAASVGDSELKDFVIKVRRPQTTRAVELTFTAATPADASLAAKKQGFLLLSDPVLKRMANDAAFSAYGVVRDRRLLKEFATKAEAEKWAASEPGSKVTKITMPGRDVRPVGDAGPDPLLKEHIARLKEQPQSAMRDRLIKTAELAIEKGISRIEAAREIARGADAGSFKPGDKVWTNPIGKSGGTVKGVVARINASGQVVIDANGRETEWHPSNVHASDVRASDVRPVGDELWTPGHKNPVPAGWLKLSRGAMRAAGEAQVAAAKYDKHWPENKALFAALRRMNEAQNKGDEARLLKEAAMVMAEAAAKRAGDVRPVGDSMAGLTKWTVWTDKGVVAVKASSSKEAAEAALRAKPGAKVDESRGINGVRKGQW